MIGKKVIESFLMNIYTFLIYQKYINITFANTRSKTCAIFGSNLYYAGIFVLPMEGITGWCTPFIVHYTTNRRPFGFKT